MPLPRWLAHINKRVFNPMEVRRSHPRCHRQPAPSARVIVGGRMHAHRPVIILSTVHCSPWRTPFATTPQVDTARKACPGTAQWARFPSSEVTKEVTSIRIQNSTHFPEPSRTPLSLRETHSRRSRSLRDGATISMRAPSRLSASQLSDGGPASAWKSCPASAVSRSPTCPDHPQWSRRISSM